MKKGFILYNDNYDSIKLLSRNEKSELLDAIFEYNLTGINRNLSKRTEMIFSFLRRQFDRDIEKYSHICERNRTNGLKGGRPKTQDNPDNPVGILVTQDNPEKPILDIKEKTIDIRKKIEDNEDDNTISVICSHFSNNIHLITPNILDKIKSYLPDTPKDWIIEAINESSTHNKRSWAYCETVLKAWKDKGRICKDKQDVTREEQIKQINEAALKLREMKNAK